MELEAFKYKFEGNRCTKSLSSKGEILRFLTHVFCFSLIIDYNITLEPDLTIILCLVGKMYKIC